MDGIFIAKLFSARHASQARLFFLEHENRTRRTAADSATEVSYPRVSHFEQTQRREVF